MANMHMKTRSTVLVCGPSSHMPLPLKTKKTSHILTQPHFPDREAEAEEIRKKVRLLFDSSEMYMCVCQSSIRQLLINSESHR